LSALHHRAGPHGGGVAVAVAVLRGRPVGPLGLGPLVLLEPTSETEYRKTPGISPPPGVYFSRPEGGGGLK
jgi:hypothetical protein